MKNLPDKIYVTPNFDRRWQTIAIDDESVEFVRKDTFIKEMCEWIKKNVYSYTWCEFKQHERGIETGKLIEDLKKHLLDKHIKEIL